MVVDYSKWDALELSDDSDFEPHPNIDKRSFIRAKQNQIHQQRSERRHRIETLKYERIINDGLLRRIDTLLAELRSREAEAHDRQSFLYQTLISSAGDPDEDELPKPPDGVYTNVEAGGPTRYSAMMGHLVDQVTKEVDEAPSDDWFRGYLRGFEGHRKKVHGLQKELLAKLAELEKEESRKITSDQLHDGFNSSSVNVDKNKNKSAITGSKTVEVLNPAALKRKELMRGDSAQSSGADADIDEDEAALTKVGGDDDDDDDDTPEASALGRAFAQIEIGDYKKDLAFLSENREVLAERETDGLLAMAFDAQMKGREAESKRSVHQALLLQYCRALGADGVGLFFKRITTAGHQARKIFLDDVETTYSRIRTRTAEILAERAANPQSDQVEQIQLQAVEPGTEIHIHVPPPVSAQASDSTDATDDGDRQARAVFEAFPPGLQRAMEQGTLERVNEVLGKMSVDEAEAVVDLMGRCGMLDIRQGVIDGTTEEGQEMLKKIKESGKLDDEPEDEGEEKMAELAEEPGEAEVENRLP